MTQQGDRQQSARDIAGTTTTHDGDLRAMFETEATIAAGTTFNGAFIEWLQARTGSASTNLPGLMQAFAEQENAHNWSSLGTFGPNAVPVNFDGTNDFLTRGADFTGNADSKVCSGSIWFRLASIAATGTLIANTATARFRVVFVSGTNVAQITARTAAGAIILDATFPVADTNWHHLLWSFDLANVATRHGYLDDADAVTWNTYTDDTIDFTRTDHSIGAEVAGGTKYNGDMADIWLRFGGAVIDFSVEANRRMFVTAGGTPAKPSGYPAGGIGILNGPVATWHINQGSGGGFTENGELTAGTGPVALP